MQPWLNKPRMDFADGREAGERSVGRKMGGGSERIAKARGWMGKKRRSKAVADGVFDGDGTDPGDPAPWAQVNKVAAALIARASHGGEVSRGRRSVQLVTSCTGARR